MVSRAAFAAVVAVLGLSATTATAQEPQTIRIEPRPFYGATVTLEAGVRVFRPLPPTRYVIVNPGGQTPLNLSVKEVRVVEEHAGGPPAPSAAAAASASSSSAGGGGGYYLPRGNGQRGYGHGRGHGSGHGGGGGVRSSGIR